MTERTIEAHKFGGTSLADAGRITAVANLVAEAATSAQVVVVVSAMAGTTDALIAAATAATGGECTAALALLDDLAARHHAALRALASGEGEDDMKTEIDPHVEQARDLLRALAVMGELRPRVLDHLLATGEKLAARLLALALRLQGVLAQAVDSDLFLGTDDRFGEARPLAGVAECLSEAALRPWLAQGVVPVVTGFLGQAPDGATTTLGRGGSDYSATLLGAALRAARVVIWTDVDGVFTADPGIVPECRLLDQINYREAAELSHYGAKILHPRTLQPVSALAIPVEIRNSLRPSAPGTVVDHRYTPGSHPLKAVSVLRDQALISLEGNSLAGVPGTAARALRVLAEQDLSVTLISQASSEASICLAVAQGEATRAEAALKREFRLDLAHGAVSEITVSNCVGLVAAVGVGMAHTPGVAARVTGALARRDINIMAIAQGSSELNISLAVDQREVYEAVRAIHRAFHLERADTGETDNGTMDLLLLGCGRVAREVAELVLRRAAQLRERYGLAVRWVALADRSGFLLHPRGLPPEAVEAACRAKAEGRPLCQQAGAAAGDAVSMVERALACRLGRPVLVDVSDGEDKAVAAYRAALGRGCDVVTANKKPLAGPEFGALHAETRAHNRLLRCEATVAAGLPVISTLDMLLASGDEVHRIEGCLSGTIGFLLERLERGRDLAEAIEEAVARGIAEPDPMADLLGTDVARKALILGRLAGLLERPEEVELEGLVNPPTYAGDTPELPRQLVLQGGSLRTRLEAARREGRCLRYVVRIERGRARIGLLAVEAGSPLARLRVSENMVLFHTARYDDPPLAISGPGAGVEVTAAGVFADLLQLAAERR